MSWPLVAIKDVARVVTGKTPSTVASDNFDGDIPFVTPSELGVEVYVTTAPRTLSAKGAAEIKLVPKNAVMVCCIGSLGKLAIAGAVVATNQQINSVIFDEEKVDAKYGFYALQLLKPKMESMSASTTIAIINKSNFEAIQIPVPPLVEQKRIVAILDEADAICRKRQQAIQLADDFLRAVFLDMFGNVVTSSGYESSDRAKISELVDYIDYRGKTPEKSDFGIPLITAKNVKKGYVDDDPREYIPEENYYAWMTRGLPRENDVLFTTEAPLGNVALLGKYQKVVIGQRLIALRSKGRVTHEYLMYLLLNPFIQDLIYARSSGSTVKGIRTKELYAIELPVPELYQQETFSTIYWSCKALMDKHHESCRLQNITIQALTQKAFQGQL